MLFCGLFLCEQKYLWFPPDFILFTKDFYKKYYGVLIFKKLMDIILMLHADTNVLLEGPHFIMPCLANKNDNVVYYFQLFFDFYCFSLFELAVSFFYVFRK